ncbi:MAG: sigma-70 family RNA polymerase sigma factor [Verrucomicrobiota bacterium]
MPPPQMRHYQAVSVKLQFFWGCRHSPPLYSGGVNEFTRILERVERGDSKAAEELLPMVYDELRRLAAQKMANEAAGHTLQPTALVHEAWMRLGGSDAPSFQNRAHFFGAAAEAMRRILIEHARRRLAAKRGAGVEAVDLDGLEISSPVADDDQLLAVNEALEKFAAVDPRKAELVKLRYFVGMNFEEAAAALGIAVPTAKQWRAYARAWLSVEMRSSVPG